MDTVHHLFLEALAAALAGRHVSWGREVSPEALHQVLDLARAHHVLPMILGSVYQCPSAAGLAPQALAAFRQETLICVSTQARKTHEFLELYRGLSAQGLRPLLVKGLICRSLYPQPDARLSGDEDLLCGTERFPAFHQALVAAGMEPCGPVDNDHEVPYRAAAGALYIELHKTLFSPSSQVFASWDALFRDASARAVTVQIQGVQIATLCPTDHMLYLIVHAFKHFLHSGFGLRQVCDMALFANAYGPQIQWAEVLDRCAAIRADQFAAAVLKIGEKYLGLDRSKSRLPDLPPVDEEPLLLDLLAGGIYGAAVRDRLHSSNMTLTAVSDQQKGKKATTGVVRTVFPAAKSLEGRYPFLRRRPWLLPAAWTARLFGYTRERARGSDTTASGAIRTGTQRIELLRRYHIID